MNLDISAEENLPFFEVLASPVRLKIIRCLAKRTMNIKELAKETGVSSAIMTSHIKKMEEVGMIESQKSRANGKVCRLIEKDYHLIYPRIHGNNDYYEVDIKVGQFTEACVEQPCGLATKVGPIGAFDDPKYFFDTERTSADLIWFSKGFIEYRIPNYVPNGCKVTCIEICAEMSSEYSYVRDNGPSDIVVSLNGEALCLWTSPGDFGDHRGKYTPQWWEAGQYGILKRYEINKNGTFLDKELKSMKNLQDMHLEENNWKLRFAVSEEKQKAGGLTIFGDQFGNYQQNIYVCVRYEKE